MNRITETFAALGRTLTAPFAALARFRMPTLMRSTEAQPREDGDASGGFFARLPINATLTLTAIGIWFAVYIVYIR